VALERSFSHKLISADALVPQQQVDDALAQLVSAELVFRRGTPPDADTPSGAESRLRHLAA